MTRRTIKDNGPNPHDVYIGMRVRKRRAELGISQATLGLATGVSFQQIQKYESGSNRIGGATMYAFSKALGVKVEYFFEGIEEGEPVEIPTRVHLELAKEFSDLSPDSAKALAQFVRSVKTSEVRMSLAQAAE